jgi:hypothetical protein
VKERRVKKLRPTHRLRRSQCAAASAPFESKSPKAPPLNINTLQKYYAAERSETIRAHGIKHIAYLKYDMSVRCKRTVEEMLDLHGSAGGFPYLAAFS